MFRQSKRRTTGRKNFENGFKGSIHQAGEVNFLSARISFYDQPPLEEITLEEFELWAIDRLKVLIEIESCIARSKTLKEIESIIKPLLLKYLPMTSASSSNQLVTQQERKKDLYSHYILRLVFCRSEDLRRKFLKNETILFKVRYNMLQPKEQQEFIEYNKTKLPWHYVTQEEKVDLFDELYAASASSIRNVLLSDNLDMNHGFSSDQLKNHIKLKEEFVKLPFEKVPSLVSTRLILIKSGYAYIPTSLQLNLVASEFQELLQRSLIRTFQALPRLEEDDRLLPLLNNLSSNFSSMEYESSFGDDPSLVSDINASSITTPTITKHFPLCAKHLQKNLVLNSHLKYQGRQQLGLFLKGIGLSVDEAMRFWSYQFTKGSNSMTMEKFNKEYKYNIRHNYGLEGARINYKPWDCSRILSKPRPGKGEYHGCPYRDLPMEILIRDLNEMGVNDLHDINDIKDDISKSNYTVACTRVFEVTHKQQLAKVSKNNADGIHINHPNLYFDRSRQLENIENK